MNGILASLTIAAATLGAAPDAPNWISDYGQALQSAQSAQRPLLVVLEKPMEPQSRIEQASFASDPVQAELLSPYLLCRVDVTTPYGSKVAAAFGATEFPQTVITDKSASKIIFRKAGRLTNSEWTSTLISHKDGQRSWTSYTGNTSAGTSSSFSTGRSRGPICFT
jgi:hypothetical protein